jgi:hypothetical protein
VAQAQPGAVTGEVDPVVAEVELRGGGSLLTEAQRLGLHAGAEQRHGGVGVPASAGPCCLEGDAAGHVVVGATLRGPRVTGHVFVPLGFVADVDAAAELPGARFVSLRLHWRRGGGWTPVGQTDLAEVQLGAVRLVGAETDHRAARVEHGIVDGDRGRARDPDQGGDVHGAGEGPDLAVLAEIDAVDVQGHDAMGPGGGHEQDDENGGWLHGWFLQAPAVKEAQARREFFTGRANALKNSLPRAATAHDLLTRK